MNIKITIPIEPKTKKNSPRIIWKKTIKPFLIKIGNRVLHKMNFRPLVISSEINAEFEAEITPYLKEIKKTTGLINYPINLKVVYYRASMRRVDLTNLHEALQDIMTKNELILDDNRDIIGGHDGSRVYYDKFNPRIEIEISEMENYDQWNNTKDTQTSLFKN